MEKFRSIFVVVFLLVIFGFSVYTVWSEGSKSEEESGLKPATKEEWIEQKVDHWVPKVP